MYILILILVMIALAVYAALRNKLAEKRGKTIQLPEEYRQTLIKVPYYQKLEQTEKKRFEDRIIEFLQTIRIEGIETEIDAKDKVLVACSAVIPVFGFPGWRYKNLTNVLLYPDTFDPDFQFEGENRNILGMVGSGYMNGQMILSKAALHKGFSPASGKENTGIHEFVHLLDKSDGDTDGVPEQIMTHDYSIPWLKLMHKEMHRINDGHSDIDVYATTNEAEFLAVASEYFFSKPEKFRNMHPEIYAKLSEIFDQDPIKG